MATVMEDPSIEINDFEIISSSFPLGYFNGSKIEAVVKEIKEKQKAAYLNYCMANLPEDAPDNTYCLGTLKSNLDDGWNSNLYNRTYNQILTLLNGAIDLGRTLGRMDLTSTDGQEFIKKVSLALQIYENTKKGPLVPKDQRSFDFLGKLLSFFRILSISDHKNDPQFHNFTESKESPLWSSEKGSNPIIADTSDEIDTTLDFTSETYPLSVKFRGEKWAVRFQTEGIDIPKDQDIIGNLNPKIRPNTPQVGQVLRRMAADLGYKVYPSMYKKVVRIHFSKEDLEGNSIKFLRSRLLSKLSQSFPQEILPKSLFDESQDFIELKGVSLEKIYDEKNYLSFNGFPLTSGGNQHRREYRALALFAAWVDLPFLDDSIGTGVFDVRHSKLNHLLYNLDYGLGYGYPNLFKKELVKKIHRKNGILDKIDLFYKPFNKTEMFSKMNLEDAKWMAEKIKEFKPEYLKTIFLESGFPDLVAEIFVKKLMDRRNQILEAFDLIDEKTPKEEGFLGTIAGYEKFFTQQGYLIDPDNELPSLTESSFPIYWSTTWFPKIGNRGYNRAFFKNFGRRILSTVNMIGVGNLHLGPGYYNNGVVFQEFATNTNPSLTECIGNCLFQGLNLGFHTLLPFRFVVENPNKTTGKPFLVVDLFRIAIKAGIGSQFYNALGVSPVGLQPALNANVFSVFEFIKIHPTDDFKEFTDGYKEGVKSPGLPIFGLQQKFIESMGVGDSILINKYIAMDFNAGAGWSAPIGVAFGGGGINASLYLMGSKILHKDSGEKVILNFSKLTAKQLYIYGRLELLGFIDRNLVSSGVGMGLKDVTKEDQIFLFDLNNKEDKTQLLESVKKLTPKNIPDEYRLSERLLHSKEAEISTRLTSFMGHDRKTKKIEAQFKNFTDGTVQKEFAFTRRLETFLQGNKKIYYYKASLNEKGDMFVKVKTFIHYQKVKRERFLKFYPLIEKQTPEDFIVFDLNSVDEDLGDVDFDSTMILSGNGIQKLLSLTNFELCLGYMTDGDKEKCNKKDYPVGLKVLIKDLEGTKREYAELGDALDKKAIFRVLKRLVNLQVHHYQGESLIKIFKTLIPREDFYQYSTLTSSNAGFPGKIKEIKLSRKNIGTFIPSARHLAESVEQAYSIFSDEIFYSIRNFVLFRDPSIEYPRTGFMGRI